MGKGTVYTLEEDFTGNDVKEEKVHLHHKFSFEDSKNAKEYEFQGENIQFVLQESESGRGSYNVGENHLIWTDGEPIDPFNIAIIRKNGNEYEKEPLLARSVKNSGNFTEFTPQQRAVAGRDPIFKTCNETTSEDYIEVPEWAKNDYWRKMRGETPIKNRLPFLQKLAKEQLKNFQPNRDDNTLRIASLAERAKIVATRGTEEDNLFPARGGNSLFRWRNGYCFYSHFVSADEIKGDVKFVHSDLNLDNNENWIIRYALGSCDADAGSLIHVFGELYIPLESD